MNQARKTGLRALATCGHVGVSTAIAARRALLEALDEIDALERALAKDAELRGKVVRARMSLRSAISRTSEAGWHSLFGELSATLQELGD